MDDFGGCSDSSYNFRKTLICFSFDICGRKGLHHGDVSGLSALYYVCLVSHQLVVLFGVQTELC